jgi:drug/metabolite transporter (DMT)-like permease
MTPDGRDGLHGGDLIKGAILFLSLGVAFVVWKFFKHNWLADHGYLPEGMRDYWMVYAVVVAGLLVWGVATRFRS